MATQSCPSPFQASPHSDVLKRDCRCRQCGGSGMLRLDEQRYRTCLDCLGQGQLMRPRGIEAAAITAAEILQRRSDVLISLSASSSAR